MNQYNNDELKHFGVKGMKWGHRKAASSLVSTGPKWRPKNGKIDGPMTRKPPKNAKVDGPMSNRNRTGHPAEMYEQYEKLGASAGKLTKKAIEKVSGKSKSTTGTKSKVSPKQAKKAAADALDKLSDTVFLNDKLPNSFAVSSGLNTVSQKLRNNESFMNAAVSGLEDYRFLKD